MVVADDLFSCLIFLLLTVCLKDGSRLYRYIKEAGGRFSVKVSPKGIDSGCQRKKQNETEYHPRRSDFISINS